MTYLVFYQKYHQILFPNSNPKKPLVVTIDIESYKKYNLEGDEEIEEEINKEEDNKQLISEAQIVKSNGCCKIF